MRNKLKAAIVGLALLLGACGGGGQLATAHAGITSGCVVGAEYAGGHPEVLELSLDKFEVGCRDALGELESWHTLSTADAGVVTEGGVHDSD